MTLADIVDAETRRLFTAADDAAALEALEALAEEPGLIISGVCERPDCGRIWAYIGATGEPAGCPGHELDTSPF